MEIQEQKHGAVLVLKPVGALVQGDAKELGTRAIQVVGRSLGRFALDVSAVPFVDSEGLEALLAAAESLAQNGQTLKLCGANETVREVLDLTDISPMFEYFAEVGDATRSFL